MNKNQYKRVLMQNAAAATANGVAIEVAEVANGSLATFVAQVTGTFSATITWEGTTGVSATQTDNTWVAIPAENVTTGAVATTTTAAGIYRANVVGLTYVRARVTWTSGTSVTVWGQAVPQPSDSPLLAGAIAGTVAVSSIAAGSTSIGGTTDNGPHWTTVVGVSGARVLSADATGLVAVTDAPTSGQKLVITDVVISVDTAMRVDLLTETTGTIHASFYLPANGSVQFTPRSKLKLPTADKKLQVDASVAGNISVTAFYYSEA